MTEDPAKRRPNGTFGPGNNANPKGRAQALPEWFVSRAPDALRKLLRVMDGEDTDDQVTPSKAAIWVAERVYGKAPKEMHHSGDVSPAVQALLELAARSAEEDQRDGDEG